MVTERKVLDTAAAVALLDPEPAHAAYALDARSLGFTELCELAGLRASPALRRNKRGEVRTCLCACRMRASAAPNRERASVVLKKTRRKRRAPSGKAETPRPSPRRRPSLVL